MAHWFVLPLLAIALGSFRRGWLYLLPLCLLLPAERSLAFDWDDLWLRKDQQAQRALAAGDTERAAELFDDPAWRGTAAYRGNDFKAAAEAFAAQDSADSWYNRGNALAGQGRYDEAIAAYEKSLELMPDEEDAKRNIETVRQLREQQQQQQSQQGQSEQQNEQQDGPDQQQQQQNGGDQDQQNQDQQNRDQQQGQQSSNPSADPGDPQDQGDQQEQQNRRDREQQEQDQGSQGNEEQREQPGGQPMAPPDIDTSAMQEDIERDQAMQQWLRRVPDDPSGLLREKFRYESRKRQQQGKSRASDKIW
jgi:Ca-activated chloride channel family protein